MTRKQINYKLTWSNVRRRGCVGVEQRVDMGQRVGQGTCWCGATCGEGDVLILSNVMV